MARQIEGKLAQRAVAQAEIVLTDCRVPAPNRLPVGGFRATAEVLLRARHNAAWHALGEAIACYEIARDYALQRRQFGKPIAGFQLTQQKLADMLEEIVKCQLLSLRLGRLKDQGKVTAVQVSLAKRSNVRSALEIARSARSIYGANGVTVEYPPVRHMLNLESVYTYEGTHEVHTLILGREITGFDAFS